MKPKVLIFASGMAQGGGSGFENLVHAARNGILQADIVGVVSNHEWGGVRERADRLNIPFHFFPKDGGADDYQRLARESGADFFVLSGWLKLVSGLDLSTRFNPRTVINIHPGPLPRFGGKGQWMGASESVLIDTSGSEPTLRFGGKGMYGHHVHEAVLAAFRHGEVTHSAVTMHFVTPKFDDGPVILRFAVPISSDDTAETLGARVNDWEHRLQPVITNLVVTGQIHWDGVDPASLVIPEGYEIDQAPEHFFN